MFCDFSYIKICLGKKLEGIKTSIASNCPQIQEGHCLNSRESQHRTTLFCWLLVHWTVSDKFHASLYHVSTGHRITWFTGISTGLSTGWLAFPSWNTKRWSSALAVMQPRALLDLWVSRRGRDGVELGREDSPHLLCESSWLWETGTHGWISEGHGSWPGEQVFRARESFVKHTQTYIKHTHHTCTHTWKHLYTYYRCIHRHISHTLFMYIPTHNLPIGTHTQLYICTCTYSWYTYLCTYTYAHIYKYTHMHRQLYSIHIYMYTQHTYTHIFHYNINT